MPLRKRRLRACRRISPRTIQDTRSTATPKCANLDLQLERYNHNTSAAMSHKRSCPMLQVPARGRRTNSQRGSLRGDHRLRQTSPRPACRRTGQARAFDFQIYQGSTLVAGTDSARIAAVWVGLGWAARLAQAIHEAGPNFTGPLQSPNEPWHYTYQSARR